MYLLYLRHVLLQLIPINNTYTHLCALGWLQYIYCLWGLYCSLQHKFVSMATSSNGNISALLTICVGNSPVTGEFPAQRPVTRSFAVFFDLRLNKRWSKQSWGWWFETPSHPLWRHFDEDPAWYSDPQISDSCSQHYFYVFKFVINDIKILWDYRADSSFAPYQCQTSLQSNAVSYWLSTNIASALRL